jgi:hypothetical protein
MHRVLHLSSTKFWGRGWSFTSGRADPNLVGPVISNEMTEQEVHLLAFELIELTYYIGSYKCYFGNK